MTSVLYITYTGLLDPLGQSQVLQYVLALAKAGHKMTVLSFEKAEALTHQDRVTALQARCQEAGVAWHPRIWHNKPVGVLATVYDIMMGRRCAIKLARQTGADIVHCRSYIAGIMGLAVKGATGARYVFDMRGFWPDERVDGGIWHKKSIVYYIFKRVERRLYRKADHVISLTKAGVREYNKFPYLQDRNPTSSVIPTCTNLELFQLRAVQRKVFTLGYVGSAGSWYLFDFVAMAVARAFEMRQDARLLVINQGNHAAIRASLLQAGVDLTRVEIRASNFEDVAEQIARMDAGVFFIRPAWSKRASCPTRMGEFLACGKPCLTNGGVGDVAEDLTETGTGIALPPDGDSGVQMKALDDALSQLFAMASDPDTSARCRAAAEQLFSLDKGVAEYARVYQRLAGAA